MTGTGDAAPGGDDGELAGPRGVWLRDGVGCCAMLTGYGAAEAWLLRRSGSGT